jgi:hypothetical protein
MKMIKVRAKKGMKAPKEGKPREYITDGEPVDVPDTGYYRRLVKDGSLETVSKAPSKKPKE